MRFKGENVFKIKAYYKAADHLSALGEDVAVMQQEGRLEEVPGIGKTLREKIGEYLETGKLNAYQKLTKEMPETLLDIVAVPSVGPKKAKLFYDELSIKNVDQLRKAINKGKLEDLPGIRQKTIENIEKGIEVFQSGQERMNIGTADRAAQAFVEDLKKLKDVRKIEVAGSLRRSRETIRDIDILVVASNAQKVMEAFVGFKDVKKINAHGETKSSILTHQNIQVDLRIVDADQFGAALLYFTGSKNFNVKLRQIAQKQKKKVNEYGIFSISGKKEKCLASKTEKACFEALDLPYMAPELREDIGEKDLWSGKKLLRLIEQKDIQGEFHVHSTYSDGKNTILEMAQKAQSLGYTYLAISDHSYGLRVARGVSIADLKKKRKEIDKLNQKLKNFQILLGSELEIDGDGHLDYNADVRSMLDICIAAIHTGHDQSSDKLTKRIIKAIQNKDTHIIAHPMGVHLGKRKAYDVNFKDICQAAIDHNVFLEINAFPIRLDLDSSNAYFAKSKGVQFVINTDAHRAEHMDYMKYGIGVARRSWLTKKDVLNTRSLKDMQKCLKS